MLLYCVLIFMTFLGSVASLFLKKASESQSIIHLISNINLYIGGGLYLTSAILNILLLRTLEYSVVLPLTSITYIWTMVLSHFILKEKVTYKKTIGVVLIFLGSIAVSI